MFLFKPKVTIEQIHNEFDSAQELLLQQALEFINKNATKEEKDKMLEIAERQRKLGFINTQLVKQADEKIKKNKEKNEAVVKSREQADLINYYSINYPFLKFITEDKLDEICQKYQLIYAPVGNYIKDVPEKNLKEIENSQKIKDLDIVKEYLHISIQEKSWGYSRNITALSEILRGLNKEEPIFTDEESIELITKYYGYCPAGWNLLGDSPYMFFPVVAKGLSLSDYPTGFSITKIDKRGLFIAAPKSHFDLAGIDQNSKFGYAKKTIIKVDDPIVFRYVRGGIQILSKWGVEGEDPDLVVPKLN